MMKNGQGSAFHPLGFIVAVVSLAACARGMDPVDGGRDVGTSDITLSEGGGSCTSSAQCSAPTPVCDPTSSRCVECTPAMDTCGTGRLCDPATRRCTGGCTKDMDCRTGGTGPMADAGLLPDGGVPPLGTPWCLPTQLRCVQCVTNDHCPIGSICNNNVCVAGCSSTRACPAGLQCCGTTCVNASNDARNCGMCGRTCSGGNSTCCSGSCTSLMTDSNNCGSCGRPCMLSNAMASCSAAMCAVSTCAMGYQDVDRNPANGCECRVDSLGGSCNTATDQGRLAAGEMKIVRGIISVATNVQYFRIAFAQPGNPRITFMTNPGGGFRFELVPACTGATPTPYTCPGRTQGATDLTSFAYIDTPPTMGMATNMPRMNPWPDVVIAKVTTTTPQTMCMPYEILLQN